MFGHTIFILELVNFNW